MRQEIFRMERVTYVEKGITQLEDFNLQIYQGEIMGFIPVNGHGLAAFLKLLQWNLPLEDGFVYYGGKLINSWKEAKKGHNRISIIQNQSCLVERMTVADNIFVIRQGFHQEIIRPGLLRRQLQPFLRDIGIDISADSYVEKLSSFERVVVEILRAVVMGYRLIVLNEISTLVSEPELRKLYEIIRKYTAQGVSFLYISLHFEEIFQICDRAAMLSDGRIQKVFQESEMAPDAMDYPENYNSLVRGHMNSRPERRRKKDMIMELRNICSGSMKHLNIRIYKGECIVIQSMDYVVFQKLTGILTGDMLPDDGEVLLSGAKITRKNSREAAVIQEQPTRSMIFPSMSYMDNLCFGLFRRIPARWREGRIRESVRIEYGSVLGEEVFSMKTEDLTEMQKYQLVYTRILLQRPKIVFCVQPFKGADMPHRMQIWKLIEAFLEKEIAVVILAINLADSMALAERLLRIDKDGTLIEISKEEFAMLSAATPWRHLYCGGQEEKP